MLGVKVQAEELTITSLEGSGGTVQINWVENPSVSTIRVYASKNDFTDLTQLQPVKSIGAVSGVKLSGLELGANYYFSVVSGDHADALVATQQFLITRDTTGPVIQSMKLNGSLINNDSYIESGDLIEISISDDSGVAAGNLIIGSNTIPLTIGYQHATANINSLTSDNLESIIVKLEDSLGNVSQTQFSIMGGIIGNTLVSITAPLEGSVINKRIVDVRAEAKGADLYRIVVNGAVSEPWKAIHGSVRDHVELTAINNTIQLEVKSYNSPNVYNSELVNITVDETIPNTPSAFKAVAGKSGAVSLSWITNSDNEVRVYRALASDANLSYEQVAAVNDENLYVDFTPVDTEYVYRINAFNNDKGSEFSPEIKVTSDSVGPQLIGLELVSNNQQENSYGRGVVNVVAQLSESPSSNPYLAFSSALMSPVNVALTQLEGEALTFTGSFEITLENFTSGVVYPIYNASDRYGNKGATIQAEALFIDITPPLIETEIKQKLLDISEGRAVEDKEYSEIFSVFDSNIILNPISASLTNKATGETLANSFMELSPNIDGKYSYNYQFDEGAGSSAEQYELLVDLNDGLNNSSEAVVAGRVQIYQGEVPPPIMPDNISLEALPLGVISVSWMPVEEVTGYQVLVGQNPNELIIESEITGTNTSLTKSDGNYYIAVRAYRELNGKIAYSPQSEAKLISSISKAPLAPSNISLNSQSTQVELTWQTVSNTITLIKRSQNHDMNNSALLIETSSTHYIDYSPIKNGHYWLASKDKAGNVSEWIHVQELTISVKPVTTLTLTRMEDGYPKIGWEYEGASSFNIYRKIEGGEFVKIKEKHTEKSYIDNTLLISESWEKPVSYKIKSLVGGVESEGVTVALPQYEVTGVKGTIRRGVVNVLLAELSNLSDIPTKDLILETSYDLSGSIIKTEKKIVPLLGKQVKPIKLVIPGIVDLPSELAIAVNIKQVRNDSVKIISKQLMTADVMPDAYELTVDYDQLRRGDISNLDISFKNNGDLPVSLRWARKLGSQFLASGDIVILVKDTSGNVLDRQLVKLTSGAGLEHQELYVVSNIAPEQRLYINDVPMMVKTSWPDEIEISLEINKIHYSIDEDHHYSIAGPTSSVVGSLIDAPYSAIISSVFPETIYANGKSEAIIQGKVISETGNFQKPIEVIINIKGFERKLSAHADHQGNFTVSYKPGSGETGIHKISAIYPGLSARPDSSYINVIGAGVTPDSLNVVMGRNFKKSINLNVTASETSALTNVTAIQEGSSELYLEVESIPYISPGETASLKVFIASNNLGDGKLNLKIKADEFEHAIGYTSIQYVVADSQPLLTSNPAFVNTSVKTDKVERNNIEVKNTGLVDLLNAEVTLQMLRESTWTTPPSWISIESGRVIERLAVGDKKNITLVAAPTALDDLADYRFRVLIKADNMQPTSIDVFHKITSSAEGSVYFSISDNYTGTQDENGNAYGGVGNSNIKIQNADVLSEIYEQVADSGGYSTFNNIPAGNYYYEVSAFDHQKITGQFQIKPGITNAMNLLIPVNTVKVSFDVIETSITDIYTVALNNTFETDVPAAIVVFEPGSVELPIMNKGEVFTDELVMTNHGLLKAYGLKPRLPKNTEYAKFEFLGDFPSTLGPGQSISIPYKVIALKDFDDYAQASATGAGERVLNVGDISVSGFYYCNAGIIIFVAPGCLFVVSKGFSFTFGGSITVEGVDLGGSTTIRQNPDGSVTTDNGTVEVTIRGGGSSSGSTTTGSTENLSDAISNNNPGGGGGGGGGSTNQPVSEPFYEGPSYAIKIDGNNKLQGCRKMTNAGISMAVGSAFAGCE
jgi:hypothetical protein